MCMAVLHFSQENLGTSMQFLKILQSAMPLTTTISLIHWKTTKKTLSTFMKPSVSWSKSHSLKNMKFLPWLIIGSTFVPPNTLSWGNTKRQENQSSKEKRFFGIWGREKEFFFKKNRTTEDPLLLKAITRIVKVKTWITMKLTTQSLS